MASIISITSSARDRWVTACSDRLFSSSTTRPVADSGIADLPGFAESIILYGHRGQRKQEWQRTTPSQAQQLSPVAQASDQGVSWHLIASHSILPSRVFEMRQTLPRRDYRASIRSVPD